MRNGVWLALRRLGAYGRVIGCLAVFCLLSACGGSVALQTTGSAQISLNPPSINFGSVAVGSSSTVVITATNTGTASLTVSQVAVTGAAFSLGGVSLPLTVAPSQSTTFSLKFAPTTAGSATGSMVVTSNAPSSPTTVSLSGTGVATALTASPTSLNFGNVAVGSSGTQTVTLTASGSSSVTISQQPTVTGAGFSASSLSLPLTLSAGQSATFSVTFAPTASGSATGSVSVASSASNSPTTVALSGNGTSTTTQLTASPTSIGFGNVTVGSSSTKTVTLTNSGTGSVTISQQPTVTGAGFSASSLSLPLTLSAGQSATFSVTFAPTAAGSVTGSISVASNASNTPAIVSLAGTGVTSISHSAVLSWTASTSGTSVVGYNVYRGTLSGGPYNNRLTSSLATGNTYTDSTVTSGQTYYYVVTAVDSNNVESAYSNEAQAPIP